MTVPVCHGVTNVIMIALVCIQILDQREVLVTMRMWSATLAKVAILLNSQFCEGKNIEAILRMAIEEVPFGKMAIN